MLLVTPEQLVDALASLLCPADVAVLTGDVASFLVDSTKEGLAPGTWGALASAGLLGLRSGHGGEAPLASGTDIMIVAESLAARLVPVPFMGSAFMSQELLRLASAPESGSSGMAHGSVRCAVLLAPDLVDIGSRGPWTSSMSATYGRGPEVSRSFTRSQQRSAKPRWQCASSSNARRRAGWRSPTNVRRGADSQSQF